MNDIAAIARENAETRWVFAKTFIEPHITAAANDPTATGLLPNHEFLIRSSARAQCIAKCRKTAHSWGIACDSLARAATETRSTSIIQSYDEDEARDKNNFLTWIYDVLPMGIKRELRVSDGSEERRFLNGSRIKFIARKAPTGAGATIYVDEFSVEGRSGASAADILIAAIGATTHGGYVRIGGTQRGPDTLFNKIVTGTYEESLGALEAEGLPKVAWEIGQFPWWLSPALCVDVDAASREAHQMNTRERVLKFGNDKLKHQFVSYCHTPEMGLDIFQREFECMVRDDSESYFPLDLIRGCYPRPGVPYWYEETEVNHATEVDRAKTLINRIAGAIRIGHLSGEWAASMDVGRDHDRSVIGIGHNLPEDRSMVALRGMIVLNQIPFPLQQDIWEHVMKTLPVVKGYVDATKGSVGRQLGEWANLTYGQRSLQFEFTSANKQIISSGLKSRMEKSSLLLPNCRDKRLEREIHSIKKRVTASGNVLFDADRNKEGHADGYWVLAMLCDLYQQPENTNSYAFMDSLPRREFGPGSRKGRLILPHRGVM